jgi:TP901 family phage tail tape measure protein
MANKTLKASVIIGGSISGAFKSALGSTKTGLKAIGDEIVKVERKQRLMARSIEEFGRMGKSVDGLRQQYSRLTNEADRLRGAQSRLANVQARIDANNARRREIGGQLAGAAATFGVVAASAFAPVRQAVAFESAMLGVAKQVEGARDANGRLTPTYFAMAKQIQRLGREIPLATTEIADMVAAGARMGVAKDQLIDFTRTAAMMADAFELPAGQLADDMGKVAGLFGIPIPRIGELADAINYLDDNAKSSGGDIIDVLRRTGGMAQALKMPAKEAAALGSTFLTMGSSAEVAGTATNAVLRILGAATAQSKRVRAGLESIGMTPTDVQASMSKDPTGTILRLLDTLNKLSDEQRMVAATRIFGAEYGDDIAKLATGASEYRRQLELVNGEAQRGSMSREFQARLGTTAAQWQITKNHVSEVAVTIGNALLPAVNRMLGTAAPLIEGMAEWSRQNPGLVKGIVGAALAVSGLRVVTLGAAYAWTAIKGPALSVMGFIARWRATGALAAMGRFGPLAMRVAGAVRTVGAAVAAIGGGPVTVAVAALTAGALVVRKYWQPIKAFLGGMFDGMREAFGPVFAELGAAVAPLKPVWDAVSTSIGKAWDWAVKLLAPVNMTSEQLATAANVGRVFGHVLSNSLTITIRLFSAVSRAIFATGRAIGSVIEWIMKRMEPVLAAVKTVGGTVSAAAGMLGLGTSADVKAEGGSVPRAKVAPVAAAVSAAGRGGRGGTVVHQQNAYHITQQPGESSEALARRIAAQNRNQDGAAKRGSLVDGTTS